MSSTFSYRKWFYLLVSLYTVIQMSSKALTVITITSCEDGSQDFVCVESVTNFLEGGTTSEL